VTICCFVTSDREKDGPESTKFEAEIPKTMSNKENIATDGINYVKKLIYVE